MLGFIWAAAAIAFIPLLLLLLLLIDAPILDITLAMLSGSIVGLVVGTLALANRMKIDKAMFLVFAGILGGAAGWVVSWVVVRITTISLFSTTAMAFDLIEGLIGAAALCFFLVDRYRTAPRLD
jgi:hypothetical protein